MNRYICDADDFYVNVHLNTEMELPNNRDTVLHFFEQMKKGFPELRNFYTRENGDLVLGGRQGPGILSLAGDRAAPAVLGAVQSRVARGCLSAARVGAGSGAAPADDQLARLRGTRRHVWVRLQLRRQSRRGGGRGARRRAWPGGALRGAAAQVINFEPSLTLALNESCQLQCRLAIETRTNAVPGPDPRVWRGPDQRLLHGAAILGKRPRA